jgi:hypothetical protein
MIKNFFVLLCSFMSVTLYGQGFAVSADRMNVVYEVIDNPLTIVVEKCSCDKMIVVTDNGEIEKGSDPCAYVLSRAKPGVAKIIVRRKQGKKIDTAGIVTYRVKEITLSSPTVGRKHNAEMSIGFFKVQLGLIGGYFECSEFLSSRVQHFKIELHRAGQIIFSEYNDGNAFTTKVRDLIKEQVQIGDRIIFRDVIARWANGIDKKYSFFIQITP